jgi:hypothetical protein
MDPRRSHIEIGSPRVVRARLLALLLTLAALLSSSAARGAPPCPCAGGKRTVTVAGLLLASASEVALERNARTRPAGAHVVLGSRHGETLAGLRFEGVGIPPGAEIASAHLVFVAARRAGGPAALSIWGEAAGATLPFGSAPSGLSARAGTLAESAWPMPPWSARGASHSSPQLRAVVQEIVDGPGWAEGNALALFVAGTGRRPVVAAGEATEAPLLVVDFLVEVPACGP